METRFATSSSSNRSLRRAFDGAFRKIRARFLRGRESDCRNAAVNAALCVWFYPIRTARINGLIMRRMGRVAGDFRLDAAGGDGVFVVTKAGRGRPGRRLPRCRRPRAGPTENSSELPIVSGSPFPLFPRGRRNSSRRWGRWPRRRAEGRFARGRCTCRTWRRTRFHRPGECCRDRTP